MALPVALPAVQVIAGAIAAGVKGILEAWPKSSKKRLKIAAPFADIMEASLHVTAEMLVEKADAGESMGPSELRMLGFTIAQAAGFADGVGDAIRGYDDDASNVTVHGQ